MSATVLLHPASRDLMAAIDWGWEMLFEGYDVRIKRLYGGAVTLIARPPLHTNANIQKRPRYAGQLGKANPDNWPPSAA